MSTADGLGRRNDDLQKAGSFVVVDALDLVEIAFARQAVDFGLKGTRRIEELRMLEDRRRGAGNQVDERLKVAVGAQGHIDYVLRLESWC